MQDSTSTATNIVQVVTANVAAISISLADINQILPILSFIIASSYTYYKWRSDQAEKKKKK
jgi:hypothetical protein